MKTKLSIFFLLLFSLLSNSCKQVYEVPLPVGTSTGMIVKSTPIIRDDVYVLPEESHNQIVSYTKGKLILSGFGGIRSARIAENGKIASISSFKKGDILVSSPNSKASNGFLIEVVDFVKDGSNYIIESVDASIEKVFKNANFEWTEQYPFEVPINEAIELEAFTTPSTKSKLELQGKLSWLLKSKFDVQIEDFEVQRAAYTFSKSTNHFVKTKVELGITVNASQPIPYLGYSKVFRLKEYDFVRTAIIPIGPIPFPIVLGFSIGVDAAVSADGKIVFEAEIIKNKSTISYEGVYQKGNEWKLTKSESGGDEPVSVTSKSVTGEVKVGGYLKGAIRFYDSDVSGIFGEIGAYGKFEVNCDNKLTKTTKVSSGLEGNIAFSLALFSDKPILSERVPFDTPLKEHYKYAEKNGCAPEDTAKVVPPIDNFTIPTNPAISTSDPHIKTLDSYRYSFMAVGEFISLKSITDNFQIQVRQEEIKSFNSEGVTSFNTGIAIHTGNDVLCIYPNNKLFVNRVPVSLNFKEYPLKNNWVIQNKNDELFIRSSSGDEIQVKFFNGSNLDYYVTLSENRKGKVRGILGNYDGNSTNDLFRGDNNQKILDATFNNLYPAYSDSWRIKQAESLFVYETGKNTDSYTDKNFPRKPITISASERAAAERTCRNAGVTDPFALENCIVDVHLTGRYELAERAIDYEQAGISLNAFSIGRFQSTDVQLDYFGSAVVSNAVVLNTSQEGFARVNMKQGVNIRNGFTTEFSFNTENFNEQSCFYLAMWPTNPAQRSIFNRRIGICFGFENTVPITFVSYDGFSGGVAGKSVIPNFTDKNIHKVRIVETPQQGGKYRLQVFFDDMNSPKMSVVNDESIESLIQAQRKTGFIEFQINRFGPSIVKVFNWSFKSL